MRYFTEQEAELLVEYLEECLGICKKASVNLQEAERLSGASESGLLGSLAYWRAGIGHFRRAIGVLPRRIKKEVTAND